MPSFRAILPLALTEEAFYRHISYCAWGRDAQRHTGMSDHDLINECVRSLAKIHNISYEKVKMLLINGVVKRWDTDEFALGAFTMFKPLQVEHI